MGITVSGDSLLIKKRKKCKIEKKKRLLKNRMYSLKDAAALIKVVASAKFDESVDIAIGV
jgi:large subunit ribosomal protein L1